MLLYKKRALRCRQLVFGYSTKAPTQLGLCLCLPRPSSSGSQELDERTLPGCSVPYPLRGPNLSFRLPVR